MNRFLVIPFILLCNGVVFGQDSIEYESLPEIETGIYLTFSDFFDNNPIRVESIDTHLDYSRRDFFLLLYREGKFTYTRNATTHQINTQDIWGYFDGQSLFLNRLNFPQGWIEANERLDYPFARVMKLGTISLVHYIRDYKTQVYTALPSQYAGATPASKPIQFFLDLRNGKMHRATLKNLENLIKDDVELWNDYKASKENKDIKMYLFLELFNKRNPF